MVARTTRTATPPTTPLDIPPICDSVICDGEDRGVAKGCGVPDDSSVEEGDRRVCELSGEIDEAEIESVARHRVSVEVRNEIDKHVPVAKFFTCKSAATPGLRF